MSLLNEVSSNDPGAWDRFVQLYGPVVYTWGRNAGLQPSDVADVTQEVFGVVQKKLDTFDETRRTRGAFRAWLWGITRLKILDAFRSLRRQEQILSQHDSVNLAEPPAESFDSDEPHDDDSTRRLLISVALDKVKSETEQRTWDAFWRMSVGNETARQIGDELRMTAKAVRQAKFRVTSKLRSLLKDDLPDLFDAGR